MHRESGINDVDFLIFNLNFPAKYSSWDAQYLVILFLNFLYYYYVTIVFECLVRTKHFELLYT